MNCPLCSTPVLHFYSHNHREFYFCSECFSVSLDSNNHLSAEEQKQHYGYHRNDANDKEYQKFVSPIVDSILKDFKPSHKGLDFGCGKDSSITKLLKEQNYEVASYDIFFANDPKVLKKTYDFIACCEVIEHFNNPKSEFERLFSLLNSDGKLYCMTELFSEKMNFDEWYYKNDPTHVFFYSEKTIGWIAQQFGFKDYTVKNRLIVFSK